MLYTRKSFIDGHPETVQKLTNALYKSLQWLKTASGEDIAAAVPEQYLLGDRALYVLAATKSKPSYWLTGVLDPAGMKSTNDMLTKFDDDLRDSHVDLATTFDGRFVARAAATVK